MEDLWNLLWCMRIMKRYTINKNRSSSLHTEGVSANPQCEVKKLKLQNNMQNKILFLWKQKTKETNACKCFCLLRRVWTYVYLINIYNIHRHCFKCLTNINSRNSQSSSMKHILISLTLGWGNRSRGRWGNLLEPTLQHEAEPRLTHAGSNALILCATSYIY